ncbi:MAG TPA: type II CAAX endopeptidase family protein [Anaerolineaceae bacterium]|nr:type II CAAX endopeptidase family protein [Anaerolineaceae bacterium]HPN51001.1 type II CAAX endopeptidase family protein [Anaerolineaceae bacterium]
MSVIENKNHRRVVWIVLGGLLFLRLPFLAGIRCFANPVWLVPVFDISTYLLTAFLIWWERDRLADYHIDMLSLGIIIFFKPLQTLLAAQMMDWDAMAFPKLPALALWVIAGGLLLALVLSRPKWPPLTWGSLGWVGIGLLAGLVMVLIDAMPTAIMVKQMYGEAVQKPDIQMMLREALPNFFYMVGFAGVTEEPLFRGFLWGCLRKAGWRDLWIFLLQAGLFTLGHIYYLFSMPLMFFIVVPVGALGMGLLAWRSKTLAAPLAAHGVGNALGLVTGMIFASL